MSAKHDYYVSECEKLSKEMKRLLTEENRWELKKDSKSCKVYSIPATQTPNSFVWKGEAQLDMKPERIYDMIHPTEKYRPMWDPNIAECRLLEELSGTQLLCHQIMKSQLLGLLSARDTIDVMQLEENDQYYCSQFSSIEYEKELKEKDCVRAWSYPSGIFIFKNEHPTKVVVFFQGDAKLDVVPPAVLNAAMPTFIKGYFNSLRGSESIQWTPLNNVPGRRTA